LDNENSIGLVTGNSVENYIDADSKTRVLTVECDSDEDVRTVELYQSNGEDSCPVSNYANVVIVKVTDNWEIAIAVDTGIEPSVDEGEKEIYSIDPLTNTKKMRIYLKADGGLEITNGTAEITINGSTNQISLNGHLTVDLL
jgi:hypothetical protein